MNRRMFVFFAALFLVLLMSCGKSESVSAPENVQQSTMTVSAAPVLTPEPLPEGLESIDDLIQQGVLPVGEDQTDDKVGMQEESTIYTPPVAPIVPETEEISEPSVTNTPEETFVPEQRGESCCEYGAYLEMTPAEQEAYMNSFATSMDFIAWSQEAENEHDKHAVTLTGVGVDLDLSQFVGG